MAKYEDLIATDDSLPVSNGRAWVFGDHVTRQQILGDGHLHEPAESIGRFAMTELDPQFAARVEPGDFVVAGLDFGGDATHRSVPLALKALGVAAVIARSFGRFFLRNAINRGLPALIVEETAAIRPGDLLRVDIEAHIVANLSSGDRYVIRNIDDETLATLRAGGLVAQMRGPA